MSSSSLPSPGSNLQSSVDTYPARDQISNILHQALLITNVPPNTKILSSFDHLELDPQSIVGKKNVGWSYNDFTLAHVVLKLSDSTQLVLTHEDASSWDEDNGDEPELKLGHALKKALESASDARPVAVEAAVFGRKTTPGWDRWAGTGNMGKPDEQKHRVLGLKLEAMEEMA